MGPLVNRERKYEKTGVMVHYSLLYLKIPVQPLFVTVIEKARNARRHLPSRTVNVISMKFRNGLTREAKT